MGARGSRLIPLLRCVSRIQRGSRSVPCRHVNCYADAQVEGFHSGGRPNKKESSRQRGFWADVRPWAIFADGKGEDRMSDLSERDSSSNPVLGTTLDADAPRADETKTEEGRRQNVPRLDE